MFIRPVPFFGVAIVATLLIALWWITGDDGEGDDPDPSTAPVTSPAVAEPSATAVGATPAEAASDDADAPLTSTVDGASGSPFATSEPADGEAGSPTGSETRSIPSSDMAPVPADDAPDGLAGDSPARTGNRVVVPSSYPVSEAAKYYIPPEERGPGNLGGPPPLDFPGGPNDSSGGEGFAPPAGPGQ